MSQSRQPTVRRRQQIKEKGRKAFEWNHEGKLGIIHYIILKLKIMHNAMSYVSLQLAYLVNKNVFQECNKVQVRYLVGLPT